MTGLVDKSKPVGLQHYANNPAQDDSFYKRAEFVRSATAQDDRVLYMQSGTLWRDPEDGREQWLHPTTVQRERMVERAREGINAEQERLDALRTSGDADEDPILSEVRARTTPPRARRERGDGQGADVIGPPSGNPVPSDFMADGIRYEGPSQGEPIKADFTAVSGEWNGYRFHFVGDQVALDNKPAREAARAGADYPEPVNVVLPLELLHFVATHGR